MTTRRPEVFLSHSSKDVVAARHLRAALHAAGVTTWMAPDDVGDGRPWAEQIATAIEDARLLLVLVSQASNASTHVAREVAMAVSRGLPLLPVRLEPIRTVGSLDYLLQLVQRIDAFPGDITLHGPEIARRAAALVAAEPSRAAASTDASQARRGPERRLVAVVAIDLGLHAAGAPVDPEVGSAILEACELQLADIATRHGGVLQRGAPESPRLVFGVPVAHEDDALRAARAAIEARQVLEGAPHPSSDGGVTVETRIGIEAGRVVATIAGDRAGTVSVAGDAPREAAGLAAAADPGEIRVGAAARRLLRDRASLERIDRPGARGERAPTYRLVAVANADAGQARRLDAPLVGRERELAALDQAYRATVAMRSCHLFTLLGQAGVGKSRLVAEFASSVSGEALVVKGRCLPYGEGITYWPLRDIVREATAGDGAADEPDLSRSALDRLLANDQDGTIIAARIASAIGLSDDPAPQDEILWATRRLLELLARSRPVVAIVEDIHWAEPALLDLLEHIADMARDAPLLLLCPARPDLLDRRPAWGGGKVNATTMLLEPLPAGAATGLLEALPGGRALTPDLRARILAAAEGNPLFVEEMLEMLIDDRVLVADGGDWRLADEVTAIAIPPTVQALLAARLDQLGPAERATAARASVVGRSFEAAAVSELTPTADRGTVMPALLALVRKELVRPERSQVVPGEAFKFRHLLIRDAAYDALPKSERAELHEHFADWLEGVLGERSAEYAEIVGYHLEQAHRYRVELGRAGEGAAALGARAGALLASAGERAIGRGDAAAATDLLGRAMALLPRDARWVEAATSQANAEYLRHNFAPALAALDEVIAVAHDMGDDRLEARARIIRANVAFFKGEPTDASIADAPMEVFERHRDVAGLAAAWAFRATLAGEAGDPGEAEAAQRALEFARAAGDRNIEARAIQMLAARLLFGPTPTSVAVDEAQQLLDGAGGNLRVGAKVRANLAALLGMRGEFEAAREVARRGLSVLDELGLASSLAMGRTLAAIFIELPADRLDVAEELLRTSYETLEQLGSSVNAVSVAAALGEVLALRGSHEEAERLAGLAAERADAADYDAQVRWRRARALVLMERREHDAAEALCRESAAIAARTDDVTVQAEALETLGLALDAAGRAAEAADARRDALARFERKEHLVGIARVRRALAGDGASDGRSRLRRHVGQNVAS